MEISHEYSPVPKSNHPTKIPIICTLPHEVRPYQKDSSEKEQGSERNPTLPVGTAEPQVGLTGKLLPPETVPNVSYINKQRSLSSQRSPLTLNGTGSLGPGIFTALMTFSALPLRQPSTEKRKLCFSSALPMERLTDTGETHPNVVLISLTTSSGQVQPVLE